MSRSIPVRITSMTRARVLAELGAETRHQASDAAYKWAREHGHKVVGEIVLGGVLHVWATPMPARAVAELQRMRSTNARLMAAA